MKFNVRSKDVIHDFWVPDFRMKIDAVPGITTNYRVTPTKLGEHEIVCAELCGLGHAYMRQTAHVMSRGASPPGCAARRGWGPAGAPAGAQGGQQAAGGPADAVAKQIFMNGDSKTNATACGGCHTLAEAGTNGQVGPDLDKALKGKDAAFIQQSIVDPNAEIAPGFSKDIMPPNYKDTLSAAQIKALVDYLGKVTK